jgi:ferredoxin like protein
MNSIDAKVRLLEFSPDDDWQHVVITDPGRCQDCRYKPCLNICPSGVFRRTGRPAEPVAVLYRQCIECGACRLACGEENISFAYPQGGHGVVFHQG